MNVTHTWVVYQCMIHKNYIIFSIIYTQATVLWIIQHTIHSDCNLQENNYSRNHLFIVTSLLVMWLPDPTKFIQDLHKYKYSIYIRKYRNNNVRDNGEMCNRNWKFWSCRITTHQLMSHNVDNIMMFLNYISMLFWLVNVYDAASIDFIFIRAVHNVFHYSEKKTNAYSIIFQLTDLPVTCPPDYMQNLCVCVIQKKWENFLQFCKLMECW